MRKATVERHRRVPVVPASFRAGAIHTMAPCGSFLHDLQFGLRYLLLFDHLFSFRFFHRSLSDVISPCFSSLCVIPFYWEPDGSGCPPPTRVAWRDRFGSEVFLSPARGPGFARLGEGRRWLGFRNLTVLNSSGCCCGPASGKPFLDSPSNVVSDGRNSGRWRTCRRASTL